MNIRWYKLVIILIFMPIFSGCWDQNIFEETGYMLNLAVESAPNNKMLITMTYPYISTLESNMVELISTTADSQREARTKMRYESSRTLAAGKLQQVLFSEEFARKGIHGALEIFERDPENSLLPWVVVIDGSPNELLNTAKTFLIKPRPAIYINQLLEANSRETYIPETRIFRFDIDYFAKGIDPITPIMKLVPNGIRVVGNALFKQDKMVGKISTMDYTMLSFINNEREARSHIILPQKVEEQAPIGNKSIVISIAKSKGRINTKIVEGIPHVDIKVDLSMDIEDYAWDSLDNPNKQKKVEAYVSKYIEDKIKRILGYVQSVGSDPLGIGGRFRAKHNTYWKSIDWDEAYGSVVFNVNVKTEINNNGVIN